MLKAAYQINNQHFFSFFTPVFHKRNFKFQHKYRSQKVKYIYKIKVSLTNLLDRLDWIDEEGKNTIIEDKINKLSHQIGQLNSDLSDVATLFYLLKAILGYYLRPSTCGLSFSTGAICLLYPSLTIQIPRQGKREGTRWAIKKMPKYLSFCHQLLQNSHIQRLFERWQILKNAWYLPSFMLICHLFMLICHLFR